MFKGQKGGECGENTVSRRGGVEEDKIREREEARCIRSRWRLKDVSPCLHHYGKEKDEAVTKVFPKHLCKFSEQ